MNFKAKLTIYNTKNIPYLIFFNNVLAFYCNSLNDFYFCISNIYFFNLNKPCQKK
jgi:hypothetical protein